MSDTEVVEYLAEKTGFDLAGARAAGGTDSELAEYLAEKTGFDLAGARATYDASAKTASDPTSYLDPDPSFGEKALVGLGSGFNRVLQGGKQLGLEAGEYLGLVDEGEADAYTKQVMEERAEFDATPIGQSKVGKTAQFAGEVLPTLLVPGGVQGKAATKMLTAGLSGGLVGGTQFVEEGESRLKKTIWGAAGGSISSGLFSGIGKLTGKVDDDLLTLSQNSNVPLTVGELRQSGVIQRLEHALDKLPLVGTRGFRSKQADAIIDAAENIVTRANNAVGEDAGVEVQKALIRKYRSNQRVGNQLYRVFRTKAAQKGGNKLVQMDNTKKAASEQIAILWKSTETRDEATINFLKSYFRAPARSLDRAAAEKSSLGARIAETTNDKVKFALGEIKDAIEKDMAAYADDVGGDVLKAYQKATNHWRDKVIPFKSTAIKKARTDELFDTDTIFGAYIKGANKAGAFREMLDLKGQQALKFGVLDNAFRKASKNNAFNPNTFINTLERTSKANKIILGEKTWSELQGFKKLIYAADAGSKLAGGGGLRNALMQAGTNIGSGAAVGGAFYTGVLGEAIIPLGLVKSTSYLLTSNIGRALLARLNKTPPNSSAYRKLMNEIDQELAKLIARAGTRLPARGGAELGGMYQEEAL